MRQRGGIEHDRSRRVGRLVQPGQQFALMLGLAHLDVEAEFRAAADTEGFEFGVRGRPVDLRLAGAESAQVGAVQDEDTARHSVTSE